MVWGIYDQAVLQMVLNGQPDPPGSYFLDLVFNKELTFDTDVILFDSVYVTREMAPFVAPNVQGRVMTEKGYSTKSFKPAYVKPKHVVDPSKPLPRMAGTPINAPMSFAQKFEARIGMNLEAERNQILRRMEWMAARGLAAGQITVAGDDYPSVTVGFGRATQLDVTLAGTAKWDGSAADPLADIANIRRLVRLIGRTSINRITFGENAWELFSSNQQVYQLLSAFYRGSTTDFSLVSAGLEVEYKGVLAGSGSDVNGLQLWVNNSWYQDDQGNLQYYVQPNEVIFTGPGIEGFQLYGAIKDRRANFVPTKWFPKLWDVEDPSVTYTMTQSAPLPLPAWPNGSARITCTS
jgi:hypothetical protein